ncbi:unnamed protein product [Chilo suppressalis]|uniref:Uncharacterized protein n=1 Tax=Chilo suppressalis TaxID=168631 RepID=A0ABN8BC35_CHISP|nr:unnamed protein product [Chilo suppressalis]
MELDNLPRFIALNTQVAQELLTMFAPILAAGLLAMQADELKLRLHDLLLVSEDKQKKEVKRFIAYVDARPLRSRACQVVPLDWNLPLVVLNLAATYLIVMLQFTHKF